MRIAVILLLALAVVAAPAAQAFACQCGGDLAAEAPAACVCCDRADCDCCHDQEQSAPSDGSRLADGCACTQTGPLAPETSAFELPTHVALAAVFTHLPGARVGTSMAAESARLAKVPRPLQVALPLLI